MRRRDARDMFDEYGVPRPQGWLSEASSGRSDLGLPLIAQTLQAYHACGHMSMSTDECPACGHDPCLKCTDQIPLGCSDSSQDAKPVDLHTDHRHKGATHGRRSHAQPGHNVKVARYSSGQSDSASTPRPSLVDEPLVSFTSQGQPEGVDGPFREKHKVSLGVSDLIASNPFVQADRNAKVLPPQTSPQHAEARRPTHMSDCVPQRQDERPGPSMAGLGRVPNHGTREASVVESTCHSSVGLSSDLSAFEQLAERQLGQDRHGHQRHMLRRHPPIDDPLGQKIDQLYHHSEDLYHSQHILEHLAAGTKDLLDNSSPSVQAHDSASQAHKVEASSSINSRLHSLDADEAISIDPMADLHGIEVDESRPTVRANGAGARSHSLKLDQVGDVHRLPRHSLLDDPIYFDELSPKSPAVGDSSFSNYHNWRVSLPKVPPNMTTQTTADDDSRYVQTELRPAPLRPSPTNLKPGRSTPNSKDRLRGLNTKSTPNLATSESSPRGRSAHSGTNHRTRTSQEYDKALNEECKVYRNLAQGKSQPVQAEHAVEEWPQLRRIDKTYLEKTHSDHSTVAPWAQHTLRKISPEQQAHQHELAEPKPAHWKQQLRKVESSQSPDSVPMPTATATWRHSLSKVPSAQEIVPSGTHCGHCNPSQATSSTHESVAGPCLVLENDGGPAGIKHLVTSRNHVPHGQPVSDQDRELPVSTPSRLRLKDLEHSLARQSAEDLLRGESHRPSQDGRKPSFQSQIGIKSRQGSEFVEIHNPKPFLPPDHACEWRARCMDLSSEVEQLKSEMGSHDVVGHGDDVQRSDQIDAGVGDSTIAWGHSDEFGIEGLTIVLHMRGKDDLVINTDLEMGPTCGLEQGCSDGG